jgi:hypothetical protein
MIWTIVIARCAKRAEALPLDFFSASQSVISGLEKIWLSFDRALRGRKLRERCFQFGGRERVLDIRDLLVRHLVALLVSLVAGVSFQPVPVNAMPALGCIKGAP